MRGARSLFNYLVPMLQDNKLKKKKQKKGALDLIIVGQGKQVALVAHPGRGIRVGWAIAFYPPRYYVT